MYCQMTQYNWAAWDRVNSQKQSFYVVNTVNKYFGAFIDGSDATKLDDALSISDIF